MLNTKATDYNSFSFSISNLLNHSKKIEHCILFYHLACIILSMYVRSVPVTPARCTPAAPSTTSPPAARPKTSSTPAPMAPPTPTTTDLAPALVRLWVKISFFIIFGDLKDGNAIHLQRWPVNVSTKRLSKNYVGQRTMFLKNLSRCMILLAFVNNQTWQLIITSRRLYHFHYSLYWDGANWLQRDLRIPTHGISAVAIYHRQNAHSFVFFFKF